MGGGRIIIGLDHVQLAMPEGGEDVARGFYAGLLELNEVTKPADLAKRGGCWFERGAVRLHLGIETEFRPARKAHPALLVADLAALVIRLRAAGVEVSAGSPLAGYERCDVHDPFGNRIELLERMAD